ncbi:DUF6799 domain-containing protein [Hymenobacter negativus]|uniref:DUF6799 domain-containing protein n=1 Tax=Hymenobacter negativus TaxID=2795026 RepID=A0ABS0Q1Q5_9BACT|nr:DUF6799 domain-containing protein [Hymenobacter negativus]MBH8556591.1 hypothetical protein [Hymenobacter negativus]
MFLRTFWLCGAVAGLLALLGPAHARQTPNNDGFQRRNGQMQVIRNGQPRPMTRDAHLPTGATVTKDGFVVSPTGQRIELREGQGCDLRGRPVAVRTAANGALALGARPMPVSVRSARPVPAPSLLEQLFGPDDDEGKGKFKFKKHKKHHGKGHGRGRGDD